MSNSSKKKIMDIINKKAKKFKEYRTNSSRSLTPDKIALIFIKSIEDAHGRCVDKFDFDNQLTKESNLMANRLRSFDPGVNVTVVWNKTDEDADWHDLRVTGIKITWSDQHIAENPDKEKEQMIDIAHLLMEGVFDDV